MDILNLQHFCGIAKKKDQQKEVKVFGDSEVFVFDILEKNDMLFFKDRNNGTICRAMGFLHLHKKMTWDQVENVMIDCGMSSRESKIEVNKEKTLIALYKDIKKFRGDYAVSQSKMGHSHSFGDWLRIPRNEFTSIFGYIFDAPIQKCSDYNICLMRDENGIPNVAHVHSTNNRFLGVVNLGVTTSVTTTQYEKVIDTLHWNEARQVLCQELDIASFISSMLPEGSSIPVGLIVNAGSVPYYGSVQFPITYWACRYDEIPHKIINFYNGNNSLLTYRMPHKDGEPFAPTSSISNLALQRSSIDFCKDMAAFSARNKTNGMVDFVRCFLSSASINRESKTVLVKEYAKRLGVSYESVLSLIRKYGIGSETVSFNKKTYFIKDSKYYSFANNTKDTQSVVVSNFIVIPEEVYSIDGKDHVVVGTYTCEGKSAPFVIKRDRFLWGNQFLEDLTQVSDENSMCLPFIYNHLDLSPVRRMIINAIGECNTKNTKKLGFSNNTTYTTSSWASSATDIEFFAEPIISAGQNDTFASGSYTKPNKGYEKESMIYLNRICSDEEMKNLIFFILKTLSMKLNGGTGTLFLSEPTFNTCAELLGCKVSNDIEPTHQLQMTLNDCNARFSKKNGIVSIILHRNIFSKTRDTIKFLNNVEKPKHKGPPLLPMLMKLALSCSTPKAMQTICNTDYAEELIRADKLSYTFQSGEAKLFFDHVKELGLDSKLVHNESGSIVVEMSKCLTELKHYGIQISKNRVLKDLKDSGVRFIYPVKKYHDRSRCLILQESDTDLFKSQ